MQDTDRPQPTPDFQAEVLDGELVIFHPAGETILHGNSSSLIIWMLCDGQRTVAEIVQLLRAAYPGSAGEIEKDVRETLQTYLDHGALQCT